MAAGPSLALVREAVNPYDACAVRVDWRGFKLGHIPRADNAAASQLPDRGEKLEASIYELKACFNPWDRIKMEVRWRG
ncbi:MAG: HIRAN domain-containing protein [Burkholderiales bacterium]|nr:HIRAN domain-containing protein [Burkholderiales bacterium]